MPAEYSTKEVMQKHFLILFLVFYTSHSVFYYFFPIPGWCCLSAAALECGGNWKATPLFAHGKRCRPLVATALQGTSRNFIQTFCLVRRSLGEGGNVFSAFNETGNPCMQARSPPSWKPRVTSPDYAAWRSPSACGGCRRVWRYPIRFRPRIRPLP